MLFEIATPIRGSALAYDCLKGGIKAIPFFRQYTGLLQGREIKKVLQRCLEKCYSLYQLLPPEAETILFDAGGQPYSALDSWIWNKAFEENQLKRAKELHRELSSTISEQVKIVSVYSNAYPTAMQYRVAEGSDYDIMEEIKVLGDNTVTCYSTWGIERHRRELVNTQPSDHIGLCQNEQVLDLLKRELHSL